ncbi:RNAS1 Ribonuclease, partial [Rhinopomastus cyanomelas]|nr:RNAS1 Ribonuclease [Rhinopomastus cyanomelas]
VASWPLCVVLVLAALAGAARETRYDKFLRQHVDYPQTPLPAEHRYCDIMVARR